MSESMFSSPSKEAQQGASGVQGIDQSMINQLESYTGQQEQAARAGIAGVQNPYFDAAQKMSPAPYRVNPAQTQTFGSSGPGTYLANLDSKSAGGQAPPWQPIPRDAFGGSGSGANKGGSNGKAIPMLNNQGGGGQLGHYGTNYQGHTEL
jgi:hypothetical protein